MISTLESINNCNASERDNQKRETINEWEILTAPSNRRLNMESLPNPIQMAWSIDRITIVGKLKEKILVTRGNEVYTLDFEQLMRINEESGYIESVGFNSWNICDKYGENIAYVEILKFQKGYGRIDFNPNKIDKFIADDMKRFIHKMFLEPHFSRADVACDILDIPDDFIRQYKVIDPVSFKPYYGRNGALETAYWGSRSSERQVRMYNKKLEQQNKRKIVPKEIHSWWRLELQLRRTKASNWHEVINESLDSFCSTNYIPVEIKATDKVMIYGLMAEHSNWSILSDKTKYKYRNMLKEISKNDELTKFLKSTFSESSNTLKEELDIWILGLDVTA